MLEPAPGVVGLGATRPDFWIAPAGDRPTVCHLAFRVDPDESRRLPRRRAGRGRHDNGEPGVREIYHQNYYGAFVLDPDGNNVEAVYHGAMQPETKG